MRLIRGLRPDRNPLRRSSDRAETAIIAGLLAAFLAGVPFTAATAAHWTRTAALREAQAQQRAWHQVPAVLLEDASPGSYLEYGPSTASVLARWTAPDGALRTGFIDAPSGTRAGITVRIWAGQSGKVTGPPLQSAQLADRAALAAILAPLIPLLAAWKLARRELYRRRFAAWDAEWRAGHGEPASGNGPWPAEERAPGRPRPGSGCSCRWGGHVARAAAPPQNVPS